LSNSFNGVFQATFAKMVIQIIVPFLSYGSAYFFYLFLLLFPLVMLALLYVTLLAKIGVTHSLSIWGVALCFGENLMLK
jgi:hypothetical protein